MADVSAKVTGVSLAVPFADHGNILLKSLSIFRVEQAAQDTSRV